MSTRTLSFKIWLYSLSMLLSSMVWSDDIWVRNAEPEWIWDDWDRPRFVQLDLAAQKASVTSRDVTVAVSWILPMSFTTSPWTLPFETSIVGPTTFQVNDGWYPPNIYCGLKDDYRVWVVWLTTWTPGSDLVSYERDLRDGPDYQATNVLMDGGNPSTDTISIAIEIDASRHPPPGEEQNNKVRLFYTYKRQKPPPVLSTLDAQMAARGTKIHITLTGENFGANTVPEFLKSGTVDTNLKLSDIHVASTSKIEANLEVGAEAGLGSRTLRVNAGNQSAQLNDVLQVVAINLSVNQGAKTGDTAARVSNHPTVVRAWVTPGGFVGKVKGLLYVFQGEKQITGSPFQSQLPSGSKSNPASARYQDYLEAKTYYSPEERFFLQDSLNFYFSRTLSGPGALPAGDYDFLLVIDPKAPANLPASNNALRKNELQSKTDAIVCQSLGTQHFQTTRPLRILQLMDNRLSLHWKDVVDAWQPMTKEFMAAAFPVDEQRLIFKRIRCVPRSALDIDALNPSSVNLWAYPWYWRILNKLEGYLDEWNQNFPNETYDWIALITSDENVQSIAGAGTLGISNIKRAMIIGSYPTTFAHETSHSLGLGDTYCGHQCGLKQTDDDCYPQSVNCRRPDALPAGNRVEEGAVRLVPAFDSRSVSPKEQFLVSACVDWEGSPASLSVLYQRTSFMGNANNDNDRWPDLAEWSHLFGRLLSSSQAGAAVQPLATESADYLVARGLMDVTGQMIDVTMRRRSIPINNSETDSGEYSLELCAASGTVLARRAFEMEFRIPGRGLVAAADFVVSAPLVAGAAEARICQGARTLFSQPVTARAPQVTVLEPMASQLASGPTLIRWAANDPDGDALTYSVFYLKDTQTLIPIGLNLTSTNLTWETADAPGSEEARVKVIASDGVNDGQGVSATFVVAKHGPSVTLFAPTNRTAVPQGAPVTLTGGGFDPEDGWLSPSQLTFFSSQDGELGSGDAVTKVLSVGAHTITLRGIDHDGNRAETSITLAVGPTNAVPIITGLSTNRAAPGMSVIITGNNFAPGASTVHFGAQVASLASLSITQCVVLVPTGLAPGPASITVTAQDFTSEPVSFTVLAGRPRILSIEPAGGAPGTPVVVRLAECDPSTDVLLLFGQTPAQVLSRNAQSLTVAVPDDLTPGFIDLSVADGQGASDPMPFYVSSGKPTSRVVLDSVSPAEANAGQEVILRGNGFGVLPADNRVFFGQTEVLPASVTNGQIRALAPAGLAPGLTFLMVRVNGYPSNPLDFTVRTTDAGPALRVELEGANVKLYWPQPASDFRLERTASLSPPLAWTRVDTPPMLVGDQWVIMVGSSGGAQYYRLSKP